MGQQLSFTNIKIHQTYITKKIKSIKALERKIMI